MNESWRKSRRIYIPEWLNTAISELAIKQGRNMDSEIELLAKAAIEYEARSGNRPDSVIALSKAERVIREKRGV
jgi:hypothetical protein